MREERAFLLVADFARLIKKHGPDALSDLVEFLRDEAQIQQLITILEAGKAASKRAKPVKVRRHKSSSTKGESVRRSSQRMFELEDGPHREVFLMLNNALSSKEILPTLSELRNFCRDNGLRAVVATSRDKAIPSFVREVLSRKPDEVQQLLRKLQASNTEAGDRSLERWTGVILDKQNASKP